MKSKPTMREQIADLKADLAGCEVHIEEIEAQNVALTNELAEAVRAAENSISLADHRQALEEKDRAIQQLRDDRRRALEERDDWMKTAKNLADQVQDNIDLLDRISRESVRPGIIGSLGSLARTVWGKS